MAEPGRTQVPVPLPDIEDSANYYEERDMKIIPREGYVKKPWAAGADSIPPIPPYPETRP